MVVTEYAPMLYNALNGVFCVYKPAGRSVPVLLRALQDNLCKQMNALPCRPVRERTVVHRENLETNLPIVTTIPDYADHPLVAGPRYIPEDFNVHAAGRLGRNASGVLVLGIGRGVSVMPVLRSAKLLRVYHVKGQFGMATHDFSSSGRIIQKTTFHHVTQTRVERVIAGMQAGHQRYIFHAAGVDMQSQEAYELASQGLLRPANQHTGPLIYSIKCIDFDLPHFTLELHCIDEPTWYLMKMVHEIGLESRSTAVCTQVHRIRYGPFDLGHALLSKHCDPQAIIENIRFCRGLLPDKYLNKQRSIERLSTPSGDDMRQMLPKPDPVEDNLLIKLT